jgi:hypothetical protein
MSEIEELRKKVEELEARELERDRELRSALLSVVAWLERTHGWEPRSPKKTRGGSRSGEVSGDPIELRLESIRKE